MSGIAESIVLPEQMKRFSGDLDEQHNGIITIAAPKPTIKPSPVISFLVSFIVFTPFCACLLIGNNIISGILLNIQKTLYFS